MNINNIKIPSNYVLVKPDADFNSIIIDGRDTGIILGDSADAKDFLADNYRDEAQDIATNSGQKKSVTGTVIKVCQKLIFNGEKLTKQRQGFSNDMAYMAMLSKIRSESVVYDVPIEVKEGDKVVFDYVSHYECYQSGQYIETEDGDYFILKYDQLYAKYTKEDGSDLYPLNGKVFVEALEREKEVVLGDILMVYTEDNKSFDTVGYIKGKKLQIGQILASGCICKGYIDDLDMGDDTTKLNNGDYIAFKWAYATPFQSEMHQKFFPNKRVMVLNRKDVALYIPNKAVINQIKI